MTNIEEDIRRDYGNYALDKKPTFTKSSISDYRLSEIKKEILFIRNFDTQNSSNFKSFFVSDFQQTISISTNFDPNKINKKFYDGKKQLQTLIDELTSVLSDFRLELYKAVMLNFIYEISTFTSNIPDQSSLQKHMNQLASGKDIYEKVINYFTKLKESYNNTSTGKNENGIIIDYKVKDYINQIDAIVSFLSYFDDKIKIIYDQDKLKGFNSLLNMAVPLKLSLYSENFEEFMNLYQSTYRFTDYLTFEWAGLSSGEKTLLGIYSRLFSVCDLARKSNEKKIRDKDILLLMDEADTYLHPQWQKEFLLRMIKYLPAIFPSNNIQILITSHSPILTSDLPGSNVAFLGVDNIKEVKTFAANIHDLYADSFYFDTVPIGNFAHLIIDSLIKQIKDKDSDIDLKFFNSILQIVGEPTLYNFLEREYLSFAKPREKIDLLKRKIEEIEKGIEND
jgi:predicted ATP-dependent endonuclease of OLD family